MSERNREQAEYWNVLAGPRWVEQEERLDAQLRPLGALSIERLGVEPGHRVLDVGCGCGDHALALAARAGPKGAVLGVDVSEPMLARARERARGMGNVSFVAADAQTHDFGGSFDRVASRFGVMFFDDFPAAFANLRRALRPGGRIAFVCWQRIEENPWMAVPMDAARPWMPPPPVAPYPGMPGPFGLDDPARIRGALAAAGFADVRLDDVRVPVRVGSARTLEEAVRFLLVAGPAAAALRGAAPEVRPAVESALRAALAPYVDASGVWLPGAAWIVTAQRD